jgi:hypothetical protein
MTGDIQIDADFPGGNILLERISGDDVFLHHDLRDTAGDWFYWAFRLRGAAGHHLCFHFTGGDVLGVRGPAVSLNGGADWEWLGTEAVTRAPGDPPSFSYLVPPYAGEVLLAFCPLYTQSTWEQFLAGYACGFRLETLCRSRAGRKVELLRLGYPSARGRLLLTARHHACETMASYCLEGILEAALAEDDLGQWLRHEINFAVIPFVDKDGVEAGDQGKNRQPYDHNRDYGGEAVDSIYPEVRAIRSWAPGWFAEAEQGLVLDLHCPWIRSGRNESVYFVGLPEAHIWRRVMGFSQVLESVARGPLPFHATDNLPYGQEWNVLEGTGIGKVACTRWAAGLPGVHLSSSLEVPYANAHGVEVTPESCRALGRDIAAALRAYLS